MTTCGYLCPLCEGKGVKEDNSDCDWCVETKTKQEADAILEEWIEKVHQGSCCGD